MGLLDSVIGGLMGGGAGAGAGGSSPIAGILMNMLGGQGGAQGQAQGQVGNQGMGGAPGMAGGIGGLLSSFQQAGLGHIAESWISGGANQPVSPGQLQNVFGESQVQNMASQAGMEPNDFLSQLSQHLPNAVNGMTPNGQVPDEGTVSV